MSSHLRALCADRNALPRIMTRFSSSEMVARAWRNSSSATISGERTGRPLILNFSVFPGGDGFWVAIKSFTGVFDGKFLREIESHAFNGP